MRRVAARARVVVVVVVGRIVGRWIIGFVEVRRRSFWSRWTAVLDVYDRMAGFSYKPSFCERMLGWEEEGKLLQNHSPDGYGDADERNRNSKNQKSRRRVNRTGVKKTHLVIIISPEDTQKKRTQLIVLS